MNPNLQTFQLDVWLTKMAAKLFHATAEPATKKEETERCA
jgi:hypothetical protein